MSRQPSWYGPCARRVAASLDARRLAAYRVRIVDDQLRHTLTERTGIEPTGKRSRLAAELPLLHRCGKRFGGWSGSGLCAGPRSSNASALGLNDHVFFWAGACAYDQWNVALVWEPAIESRLPSAVAAPWDTGGLMTGSLGKPTPLAAAKRILGDHTLPVPDYRRYLASVLECCFASPAEYLRPDGRPLPYYPGWLVAPRCAKPPQFTFEVRAQGTVDFTPNLVAVVVDEPAFGGGTTRARVLRELKRWSRRSGAEWVPVESHEEPHEAAQRYVQHFLEMRGVPS